MTDPQSNFKGRIRSCSGDNSWCRRGGGWRRLVAAPVHYVQFYRPAAAKAVNHGAKYDRKRSGVGLDFDRPVAAAKGHAAKFDAVLR
jgi:hypothetical protein